MTHHHDDTSAAVPADHWEARYAGADRVWSGKVNATTAAVVAELMAEAETNPEVGADSAPSAKAGSGTRRTAVDLGCGEGGDALWLAEQGWDALGIDISPTAVARASSEAKRRGVSARFEAHDLETWAPDGTYDLITASFLHSTVALSRRNILRTAAGAIAQGGHLVLVSHLGFPSWSGAKDHEAHNQFLTPSQELESLALAEGEWTVVTSEIRRRKVTAPDGTPAELDDAVLVLRRD